MADQTLLEMYESALQAKYLLESFIENHKDTVIHENVAPVVEKFKQSLESLHVRMNEPGCMRRYLLYTAQDLQLLGALFIQTWGGRVTPTELIECGFCHTKKAAAAMIPGRNIFSTVGCGSEFPKHRDPSEYWDRCHGCQEKLQPKWNEPA